jgi:methyl-accepting chemotaxis protein
MIGLRNIPISRRLWLILLISVLMLLILTGLMLKQNYDDLYAAKALKTQHVVESVESVMSQVH